MVDYRAWLGAGLLSIHTVLMAERGEQLQESSLWTQHADTVVKEAGQWLYGLGALKTSQSSQTSTGGAPRGAATCCIAVG